MVNDLPEPRFFAASVGTLVQDLGACGKPLRIYGEMVDVLVGQGNYSAAAELEELWNDLGRGHRFTLFCGYMSGHFGDPRNTDDLERICTAHSHVRAEPDDVLGTYLVRRHSAA